MSQLLLLLQLLMLFWHLHHVHAHGNHPFTTLYRRCERKSDLHAIHQIETFFDSSHFVRDQHGFYIDNGITVIPPDQYPCSHSHHQGRDLEEFDDDDEDKDDDSQDYDNQDADTDAKVHEFELMNDQHGILRQEQYIDREDHRRLTMGGSKSKKMSGKSDDMNHNHFKGGKGVSKASMSSIMMGGSGKFKMMMMMTDTFHYNYIAMAGDKKETKYKDYYYYYYGKTTTNGGKSKKMMKKDHHHYSMSFYKKSKMHGKHMKHRWRKMGKGKGGETKGKGQIGWEIFKCPVMPLPPTLLPTTTTDSPNSTPVPATTAPSSDRNCFDNIVTTFTTTIILDIDNFEPVNASPGEITALENVLRDAYMRSTPCPRNGALHNILNVSLVTNVTDSFGDPILPIPWTFEIEAECNGCNGALFRDDISQNQIDFDCQCFLPTLSEYLAACNEILAEQPLPNINRIRNIQVLQGVGGIFGGVKPFSFQTYTVITVSCRPNVADDGCLESDSISWLELNIPIVYNRLNVFNLALCDPDGRVVKSNATFKPSAVLNNGSTSQQGELLTMIFELNVTCRGPNCESETVIFGNCGNIQGDAGAATGRRRDLLDISSVCPGGGEGVDLRCPSTNEFAKGLQEEIEKSGDSLPFDRVVNVTEISFSPPTPWPTPSPPTPSPGSPSISPATASPIVSPATASPSVLPTSSPNVSPTSSPTVSPSAPIITTPSPTPSPPTPSPGSPSVSPATASPSVSPATASPSVLPTSSPNVSPTSSPTVSPSASLTVSPSASPTVLPATASPSVAPEPCCVNSKDGVGNKYGEFIGTVTYSQIDWNDNVSLPINITYTEAGIYTVYTTETDCGNQNPITPSKREVGRVEWTVIDDNSKCNLALLRASLSKSELSDTVWRYEASSGFSDVAEAEGDLNAFFFCDPCQPSPEPAASPNVLPSASPNDLPTTASPSVAPEPCCVTSKDGVGNNYGEFNGLARLSVFGTVLDPYNISITYNASGIYARYPDIDCGNKVPIKPSNVQMGLVEWTVDIDCVRVDGFDASLNKSSDTLWLYHASARDLKENGDLTLTPCVPC